MYGRRRPIGLYALMAILLIMGVMTLMVDLRLKNSALQIAKSQAQVTGVRLINQVIAEKMADQVPYEDLVNIHKDSQGKIVLIQPNTITLNRIMSTTAMEISSSLGEMEESRISIPLGQLCGSTVLAGYGPKMQVRMIPTGQVRVDIQDKFEQAGINQTRHMIYFYINATVQVAVPFMREKTEVSAVVPLAETIVVGDVPQTFVNLTGNPEMVYPYIKDK